MPHPSDLTLRFVTEFECTGGDCPDNCCHGWRVILDQDSYQKLESALTVAKEPRQKFRAHVSPNKNPDLANFATIAMADDGCCPYQNKGSGLCEIHTDLGEQYLGRVCSIYPRQLNRVGERTELSLSLSCPVAARACLIAGDAVEPVPLPPELVANEKYFLTHQQEAEHPDPYFQHSDLVRQILWQLLGLSELPLASRLFVGAYFASRVAPFYHAGTSAFDPHLLADEVDRLGQPELINQWHRQYQETEAGGGLAMSVILTILVGKGRQNTSLSDSLADIWQNFGWSDDRSRGTLDFSGVVDQYAERQKKLAPLFGPQHDLHMTNFCFNHLFREPSTTAPTLLSYLQNLFIRRAILRFLVFSAPQWNDVLTNDGAVLTPELAKEFEEVSIEMFYRFSRTIEHDSTLTATIQKTLAEQDMESLAHLVLLLKV